MSTDGSAFGPWLRRKLSERHLSLAQLCRSAGCDYTYLWRIIHAETARGRKYVRPSYALTQKIGQALDAPREALVAAGYAEAGTVEEARVEDRLSQLQRDLDSLRANLGAREAAPSPDWAVRRLPLLGRIRAGALHEALEHPGEWIELPEWLAANASFGLRVVGDSMRPTLLEGDVVAVRAQPTAEPGQLVAARVGDDDEVTLKRFDQVDGVPMLVADNPAWKPVPCGPKVRIVGVVTGSFRPPEVLRRRPETEW